LSRLQRLLEEQKHNKKREEPPLALLFHTI